MIGWVWLWLLIAVLAVLFLALLWLVQRRTGDAGIADVGWSAGMGASALACALLAEGSAFHRAAVLLVGGVWSARLAYYILKDRVLRGAEDGRYQYLRELWGEKAQRNLFFFFQAQAVFIILFTAPFLLAATRTDTPGWMDGLGILAGLGAVLGEAVADGQLRRWRRNPDNRGKTCRGGLWRYSRHPNYFFEWCHWWAYPLLCAGTTAFWPALLGPAVMLLFLFRLTGIPYTEKQALKSRGEDYRRYQRETSAFVPWFPKRSSP